MREPSRNWLFYAAIDAAKRCSRHHANGAEYVRHLAAKRQRHDAAIAKPGRKQTVFVDAVIGLKRIDHCFREVYILPIRIGPTVVRATCGGRQALRCNVYRVGETGSDAIVRDESAAYVHLRRGTGAMPKKYDRVRRIRIVVAGQDNEVLSISTADVNCTRTGG